MNKFHYSRWWGVLFFNLCLMISVTFTRANNRQMMCSLCCTIGSLGNVNSQGFKNISNKLDITNEFLEDISITFTEFFVDITASLTAVESLLTSKEELERVEMHCPIILYASDFGTTGTVLDSPGYYILCEDVPFNANGTNAVTIASSHVTLDMNNHAIYQINFNLGVSGVVIDVANLKGVTIKNGTLANFTNKTIEIAEGGVHNIALENLQLKDGNIALEVIGTFDNPIHDIKLQNCSVTKFTGVNNSTCIFNHCENVNVNNCSFTNNRPEFIVFGYIISTENCKKFYFTGCHFDDNILKGEVVVAYKGFFDSCTFNNNLSLIVLSIAGGTIVRKCIFNSNKSNGSIRIIDFASEGNSIESCQINYNVAADGSFRGITFYGDGSRAVDCTLEANRGVIGSYSIYFFNNSDSCLIQNCTVLNQVSTFANGIGVLIDSGSSRPVVQNCSVFGCSGYGIYNDSATSIVVGCVAGRNGIADYAGVSTPNSSNVNPLGANVTVEKFMNVRLSNI